MSSFSLSPKNEGIIWEKENVKSFFEEIRKQEKDVPLISNADIIELPKGQCFASIDGGNIYKLKMPLVEVDRNITPETLAGKVRNMRRAYKRSIA